MSLDDIIGKLFFIIFLTEQLKLIYRNGPKIFPVIEEVAGSENSILVLSI
jgi:hypothetical protein